MNFEPYTLPDDPRAALADIASYLRTLEQNAGRAVWYNETGTHLMLGPKRNHDQQLAGYWQTPEWFQGLEDIARECDRLAAHPQGHGAWFYFFCTLVGIIVGVLIWAYALR